MIDKEIWQKILDMPKYEGSKYIRQYLTIEEQNETLPHHYSQENIDDRQGDDTESLPHDQ